MSRWSYGVLPALALVALALYLCFTSSHFAPATSPATSRGTASPASPTRGGAGRGDQPRGDLGARSASAPRAASPGSTRLAQLGWGSKKDQLGRRQDPESAAEGPMAITAGRDGTLYVLDQVHGRVLRRSKDGSFGPPIVVGAETVQDLRATADGLAVLDRLGDKTLRRYDASGRLVEEKPLASLGVVEPGGTTGLFSDGGGALYVEESLAGQGRRVVRPVAGGEALPGRPSRDGTQLLTAQIVRAQPGAILVRGLARDSTERFATTLTVDSPVMSIALLDSDPAGGIYVGVLHATAPIPPSRDASDERLDLFRLDAAGRQLVSLSVAHPPSALESFRELEVADVGIVWWMHPLPDGSGVAIDALRL